MRSQRNQTSPPKLKSQATKQSSSAMEEQAPPPYTPNDSHSSVVSSIDPSGSSPEGSATRTSLRGGYVRRHDIPVEPTFPSARRYFDERPCPIQSHGFVLQHSLNLIPGATRDDLPFPQPEARYSSRNLTAADWDTFVNYLLPTTNASEKSIHGSFVEPESPAQQERFAAIVTEWNEWFFSPRGIHIHYEPSSVPSSSRSTEPQPAAYGAPPQLTHSQSGERSFGNDRHHRSRHYEKRPSHRRSFSTSSSSSSSSSSSTSSVDSISSRELQGLSSQQIQNSFSSFRQNARTDLASAIAQLRKDLRSQTRAPTGLFADKAAKAQTREWHRELRGEIRALQRSRRDQKRPWRQEKRALKRERRQARRDLKRENKALWKEEKQKFKAARKEAKQERKAAKNDRKMERKMGRRAGYSGPKIPEHGQQGLSLGGQTDGGMSRAHSHDMPFRGQQTGVVAADTEMPRAHHRNMPFRGPQTGIVAADVGPLGELRGMEKSDKAKEAGF